MSDPIIDALENISKFKLDTYCEGYPDVIFEIIFVSPPENTRRKETLSVLEKFIEKYNKKHFLKPIHFISILEKEDYPDAHPYGVYIHIDFGNSNPNALIEAVQELEKSELPIFRVALL